MAGDWIKMTKDLADKPEVRRLARSLNLTRYDIIGRLHAIWSWADTHSISGSVMEITEDDIDDIADLNGFAVALRQVGWLSGRSAALEFPHFDRHNGQTAKRRAQESLRMNNKRKQYTQNANICTHEKRTDCEPEKRREEKNINNSHLYSEKHDLSVCVPPERLNPVSDSEAFSVFLKAICDLRPAWERVLPHGVEVGLAKELYESVKGSIKPSDMALLKAYLNDTKTPRDKNNDKFWKPENRKTFIENFAGILASAERWKKETKWKLFKAPVKQQQEESVSDEPAASVEDFRKLLK